METRLNVTCFSAPTINERHSRKEQFSPIRTRFNSTNFLTTNKIFRTEANSSLRDTFEDKEKRRQRDNEIEERHPQLFSAAGGTGWHCCFSTVSSCRAKLIFVAKAGDGPSGKLHGNTPARKRMAEVTKPRARRSWELSYRPACPSRLIIPAGPVAG